MQALVSFIAAHPTLKKFESNRLYRFWVRFQDARPVKSAVSLECGSRKKMPEHLRQKNLVDKVSKVGILGNVWPGMKFSLYRDLTPLSWSLWNSVNELTNSALAPPGHGHRAFVQLSGVILIYNTTVATCLFWKCFLYIYIIFWRAMLWMLNWKHLLVDVWLLRKNLTGEAPE